MDSRRLCRFVALLLALCLWLQPEAGAAPSPFRVLDYDTRVEIETDGDILVRELITIDIPTSGTNKGIIRDIPTNARWKDKGRQGVKLDVLSVRIDGKACPTDDTESTYPVLSIYMRDRSSYLSAGEHRFELCYRMSEQIGFFEEGDELTWNAVGEGWEGGVQKARATIFPPQGTAFTQHRAWLGSRGSRKSSVSTRTETVEGREALVFEASRPMREGEIFTCAVGWPSGVVAPPVVQSPEEQWGYTLFYAACFLASLAAAWFLWNKYGRDPEAGAVIPLFYPPKVPQRLRGSAGKGKRGRKRFVHGEEYMTPAAVHYVHEGGKLESRGLAALFLSLAQRGDCSLRGSASKEVVVEKHANTSPAPEEQAAADKLPDRLSLTPRKSTHSPIGKVHDACKLRLDYDYPMVVEWNIGSQVALFVLILLLLVFAALSQLGDSPSELVYQELSGCLMGLGFLLCGAGALAWQIRGMLKNHGSILHYLTSFLFCAMFMVPGYFALEQVDIFWIYSPVQLLLMLAALIPPLAFAFLMDMPTREQVELRREIEGLALYIGTAETERFNLLNPPEEDLQLYHRLLPYAVALGLEDAWGKRFADKLARALAAGTELPEEVMWDVDFTRSLVRSSRVSLGTYREAVFAEQAARYASESGGGSSFGGFGGGAGSGGGGGGGRAC